MNAQLADTVGASLADGRLLLTSRDGEGSAFDADRQGQPRTELTATRASRS